MADYSGEKGSSGYLSTVLPSLQIPEAGGLLLVLLNHNGRSSACGDYRTHTRNPC